MTDFADNGTAVIERLRAADPEAYLKLVLALVPREALIQHERDYLADAGDVPASSSLDKVAIVRRLLEHVDNACMSDSDRLTALKLLAEISGLTGNAHRPGIQIATTNKVMVVRDFGSDEDWENSAVEQQRVLIEAATAE